MKNKITLMDIKSALWDERFRNLFPEHKEQIAQFLKDPGCGCNVSFLRNLMRHKDRLKEYFPTKEVVTPEEEEEAIRNVKNNWKVVNCNIHNLAEKMKEMPKGKRLMAASRFRDKITLVFHDVETLMTPMQEGGDILKEAIENKMNWKIINTTIFELEKELASVEIGRKALQITRFKEQVTAIINDLNSVF